VSVSGAPGRRARDVVSGEQASGSRWIGRALFAALVVATIAAFVISQHLKVTTPFISGVRGPDPTTINPVSGPTSCPDPLAGHPVSQRSTTVSFYILHQVDNVNVYVVDQSGTTVRTLASNVFMRKPKAPTTQGFAAVTKYFTWDGRDSASRPVSPGSYFFYVHLVHQQRTIELSQQPVTVERSTRCVSKG
jgi:hypothetical protein